MRATWLTLVLAAFVAHVAPVRAQSEVLAVIPDDVMGFGVINRLAQANEKTSDLAKRMNLPLPANLLALGKAALGVEKGLAEGGSVAIALYPGKADSDEPRALVYFPVTDYEAFIAPWQPGKVKAGIREVKLKDGKTMLTGKRGMFAVLTEPQHQELLVGALASTTTLAASTEPLATWLSSSDVAGVLTARGIKLVTAKLLQGVAEGKGNLGALPPEAQFVGKFFDSLESCIKSIETDVSHFGLSARLDGAGNVHLNLRAQFVKASGFAKSGGAVKALPGGPLAGLPAGPFVFAVGGTLPEGAMQSLTNLNTEILKAAGQNIPEESMKKLEKAYANMGKGLNGMGFVWQVGKNESPLFANMIAVMQTADAQGYMAEYEKSLAATNELLKELNIPAAPAYQIKKVKINGKTVLEMTMDFAGLGLPDEVQGMFKNIFGPDGKMNIAIAARDDKTIVMRYTAADGLKDILAGKDQGLAKDAGVVQLVKTLPTGSQWAFFLSLQGATQFADRTIKALAPIPLNIPQFPAAPPVGVAIRVSGQHFEVHAVVPAVVLENVVDYVQKLKAAFGGGA